MILDDLVQGVLSAYGRIDLVIQGSGALLERATVDLQAPDIIVNNSGGPPSGNFRDWDRATWRSWPGAAWRRRCAPGTFAGS